MKRIVCFSALLFAFTLATPRPSAACYDRCAGAPGTCRTCETGFDVTFQVCLQTAPCRCITYAVPSYQCTGFLAAATSTEPSFLAPEETQTPSRPAGDLSFLALAR